MLQLLSPVQVPSSRIKEEARRNCTAIQKWCKYIHAHKELKVDGLFWPCRFSPLVSKISGKAHFIALRLYEMPRPGLHPDLTVGDAALSRLHSCYCFVLAFCVSSKFPPAGQQNFLCLYGYNCCIELISSKQHNNFLTHLCSSFDWWPILCVGCPTRCKLSTSLTGMNAGPPSGIHVPRCSWFFSLPP